ncbi:hypothetical protein BC827DRAFT_1378065 [Russula dissimulans]|nr:hypothetical protein BC827DRAFT_1378065 [Russula dissimulans]
MDDSEIEAFAKNFQTVIKVLHFIDGAKFLYFLSHLDFDWRLLHHKPTLSWPGKIYLANRLASVACVVSTMVGLNVPSPINCQAWISTAFAFPLLELELALTLLVFRVIAIWHCSYLVTCLTAVVLSIHSGVTLHLLTGVRVPYSRPAGMTLSVLLILIWIFADPCVLGSRLGLQGLRDTRPRMHLVSMSIATMGAYAVLLITMLLGLLRQRPERSYGVWDMLCQQGWMWFALAVVAEVPTLFLVLLNINHALNGVLQVPRVVIASVGTTTMFRILYNYPGRQKKVHQYWGAQIRCEHVLDIILITA